MATGGGESDRARFGIVDETCKRCVSHGTGDVRFSSYQEDAFMAAKRHLTRDATRLGRS